MKTKSDQWLNSELLTVGQIIEHLNSFGIPHFQRGQVWKKNSVLDLLDSLYKDIPCGTIILAMPPKKIPIKEYGEGLINPENEFDYLIVDGQQRITSLWYSFSDNDQNYCINLNTLEDEIGGMIEKNNNLSIEYLDELFIVNKGDVIKNNILELKSSYDLVDINNWVMLKDGVEPATFLTKINSLIKEKILDRKLYVKLIEFNELSEIIELYNRINSAGIRVEKEEKTFASLVSIDSDYTLQKIREIFQAVHGSNGHKNEDINTTRNNLLKREKEKNFGFKLFIRTFILVYQFNRRKLNKSNAASFDIILDKRNYQELCKDGDFRKMWDITANVLIYTKVILKELYCNNLAFLPEANALLPFFAILIKFPELYKPTSERYNEGSIKLSKYILLRLLLNPNRNNTADILLHIYKNVSELKDLVNIFEENSSNSGIEKVLSYGKKSLSVRLKDTETLMEPHVLYLYWMLSRNQAADFSYKDNGCKGEKFNGEEVIIGTEGKCFQKQHIIPVEKLKKTYGYNERPARHQVNNIGNLTYITAELNGFEGLSSNIFNYRMDDPNLGKHYLPEKQLRKLTRIKHLLKADEKIDKEFNSFAEHRCDLIADGFITWLQELKNDIDISYLESISSDFNHDLTKPVVDSYCEWAPKLLNLINNDVDFKQFGKWTITNEDEFNKKFFFLSCEKYKAEEFRFFDFNLEATNHCYIQLSTHIKYSRRKGLNLNSRMREFASSNRLFEGLNRNNINDTLYDKSHVFLRKIYPIKMEDTISPDIFIYNCLCSDWKSNLGKIELILDDAAKFVSENGGK
ncbi:MAG: DUF262 domain-containing protein [Ignavibacteria bacterium]|nr:DUF262 domain-containing protein [Ignavibacteria bacterium]MCU7522674.1 DUF262 domain-containing protein [Ignavibacteria bacterium]